MVQSLNTKALATLAYVIRHPTVLVPHVSIASVSQLNYTALREEAGVEAVVFDKDNTLTAPYGMEIHPEAARGLESATEVFGRDHVAILSNSAGTKDDPGYEDATRIEEALGIAVIRHDDKKPGGLREVLDHFRIEDPSRVCMVGDRLLTDVVFGNLYGMLTVHTLPLCRGAENARDNKPSKIIRYVENKGLYGSWFGSSLLYKSAHTPGAGKAHEHWPGETESPLTLASNDEAPKEDETDS